MQNDLYTILPGIYHEQFKARLYSMSGTSNRHVRDKLKNNIYSLASKSVIVTMNECSGMGSKKSTNYIVVV